MIDGDAAIWLAGAGNMGGAMLRRWLEAGLSPARVTVIRPSGRPAGEGVRVVAAPPEGTPPALLMLGVKPHKLDEVAPLLAAAVGPETMLVSILAGVEIASLRRRFPHARAIVRAMPNTPVAIGRGVVGLYADADVDEGVRSAVQALMAPLGLVEWMRDEAALGAVTVLAGSGPAFLFRFVEALAAGGEALGLMADQAARLAIATVDGAAGLAAAADEAPDRLADRVASPGGSTRAGLDRLDRDDSLRHLLVETLSASDRRNAEMAAAAR